MPSFVFIPAASGRSHKVAGTCKPSRNSFHSASGTRAYTKIIRHEFEQIRSAPNNSQRRAMLWARRIQTEKLADGSIKDYRKSSKRKPVSVCNDNFTKRNNRNNRRAIVAAIRDAELPVRQYSAPTLGSTAIAKPQRAYGDSTHFDGLTRPSDLKREALTFANRKREGRRRTRNGV